MPKNLELSDAISSNNAKTKEEIELRNKALQALLACDPNNKEAFRKAVVDHKAHWGEALITVPAQGWFRNPLKAAPKQDEYEKSDEFLDATGATAPPFKAIRQKAVQELVKQGLANAPDDVIVAILQNNPPEVRAYLASRTECQFLTTAPDWAPSVEPKIDPTKPAPTVAPKASNNSVDVLSDAGVVALQNEFAERLLLKNVAKLSSYTELEALLSPDSKIREKAAADLKLPPYISLKKPLSEATKKAITDQVEKLKKAEVELAINYFVTNLTDTKLIALKGDLETDDLDFIADKLPAVQGNQAALEDTRRRLIERFLQVYLPTQSTNLEVLNAPNLESMRNTLSDQLGSDAYEAFITEERSVAVKQALLQGVINHHVTEKDIEALVKAPNVDQVRAVLQTMGVVNLSWVNDAQLTQIKQAARARLFMMKLNEHSPFGNQAHSELVAAFAHLPVLKQNAVLVMKPKEIRHLLRAEDATAIKHYLGHELKDAERIGLETERNNRLTAIHNAEIVKALASFKPAIKLDGQQITAINALLVDQSVPPVYKPVDSTVKADYKGLVDNIRKVCAVPNAEEGRFYAAFGLTATGDFTDSTTPAKIGEQHKLRKDLLNEFHDPLTSPFKKALLEVVLSLPLTVAVTPAVSNILEQTLADSDNMKIFLETLKAHPDAGAKALGSQLEKDLTKAEFDTIKNAQLSLNFDDNAQSHYETSLETLIKNRKLLTDTRNSLRPLLEVESMQLLSPAFQGKAKKESDSMLAHYKQLANQVELTLDSLRREKHILEGYLATIPPTAKKLRKGVEEELRKVVFNLDHFEKVLVKLHGSKDGKEPGLIATIENALKDNNTLLYKSDRISYEEIDVGAPLPDSANAVVKNSAAAVVINSSQSDSLAFLMGNRLEPNKQRVYNFVKDVSGKKETGQFTEQFTSTAGEFSGKLQVTKFPTTEAARVEFALALAVQGLANAKTPPSANKRLVLQGVDGAHLEYLYAAFISLGVPKDAIVSHSSAFDPETQYGRFYGVANDSTLASFSEYKALVKQSIDALSQITNAREDKHGVKSNLDASVKEAVGKVDKESLREITKQRDEEGPAPSGPRK